MSSPPVTPVSARPVPEPGRMRPGALAMVLIGALLVLVGGGIGLGGAVVAALAGLQQDGNFLNTSTQRFEYDSYALTTPRLEEFRSAEGPISVPSGLATLRLQATEADPGRGVFIGVAPAGDVSRYLSSVHHTELVDVRINPFRAAYREVAGTAVPPPPTSQTFWTASASGSGTQEVTVELGSGNWAVVVMNADGRPSGIVDLQAGFRSTLFAPIGLALLISALVLFVLGIPLVLAGAVGLGRGLDPGLTAGPALPAGPRTERFDVSRGKEARDFLPYPSRLSGYLQPNLSRGLWLVKWFLAIPHFIVLVLLWVACWVCTVAAGFVILFSGRYPKSLFPFTVGVFRWTWRVQFYASALGTDRYPPFTLAPSSAYPADFQVPYPATLGRGVVLVKWWLLALPHLFIVAALTGAWSWSIRTGIAPAELIRGSGPSLLSLLILVAGFALLFTARYPRPLFDLVMGIHRWVYRVLTYVFLLRDEYPPFRLDQGPDEGWAAPVASPHFPAPAGNSASALPPNVPGEESPPRPAGDQRP
jgi:Domain of unknown function (DUF4389)